MNPWDAVTWIACAVLAGSAVLIFGFFLRDARHLFDRSPPDAEGPAPSGEAGEENCS